MGGDVRIITALMSLHISEVSAAAVSKIIATISSKGMISFWDRVRRNHLSLRRTAQFTNLSEHEASQKQII